MKVFLGILIAAQLMGAPAMAVDAVTYQEPEEVQEELRDGDPMRPEEFMWFFRYYEGRKQKRLWSLTYGHWVTDWIDCD